MNSWPVSWQFTIVVGGQNVMGVCLDPTWLKHQANANDKNLLWSSCYWLIRAVQNRSGAELRPGARMLRTFKATNHKHLCQVTVTFSPQSGIRDRIFLGTCLCGTLILFPLVIQLWQGPLPNIHVWTCQPDVSYLLHLSAKLDDSYPGRSGELKLYLPLFQMKVLFKMASFCFLLTNIHSFEAGKMAKWLQTLAAFPGNLSFVPIHTWLFKTICNFSSRGSNILFYPPWAPYTQTYMQARHPHTYKN